MKILVTGGAGYIGSHLVDRLLENGDQVVVLDDFSIGKKANIQHHLDSPSFRLVQGSITEPATVAQAMEGCEVVYHLAARVGIKYIVDDPLRSILTNVRGTEIVVEGCHRRGCKLVFASTSEIYGKNSAVPFSEDSDRVLGPTRVSRWCYSAAKALDEHLVLAYARRGLWVTIVRYFNSYGPRLDPEGYGSVIAKFITQALQGLPITVHGDGKQTRSFTYVDDTVRGTMLAASSPSAQGEALNVGCDRETAILELAEKIKGLTRSPSPITFIPYEEFFGAQFEDIPRRVPKVEKARRLLGFEATVPLEEGLRITVDWMRNTLVG